MKNDNNLIFENWRKFMINELDPSAIGGISDYSSAVSVNRAATNKEKVKHADQLYKFNHDQEAAYALARKIEKVYTSALNSQAYMKLAAYWNATFGYIFPKLPRDASAAELRSAVFWAMIWVMTLFVGGPIIAAGIKVIKALFAIVAGSQVATAILAGLGVTAGLKLILSIFRGICENWENEIGFYNYRMAKMSELEKAMEMSITQAEEHLKKNGFVLCKDEDGDSVMSHPEDCAPGSIKANESLNYDLQKQTKIILESYISGTRKQIVVC